MTESSLPVAPDPPGPSNPLPPLRPLRKRPLWHALLRATGVVVAVGGAVFVVIAGTMPRLSGATRSARLKWQERQRQVDRAVERATELSSTNGRAIEEEDGKLDDAVDRCP